MSDISEIINGVKHIKIQYPISTKTNTDKLRKYCEDNDIIMTGVSIIKQRGWLSNGLAGLNLLVPESQILQFNKQTFLY